MQDTDVAAIPDSELVRSYVDACHRIRFEGAPMDSVSPFGEEIDRRILAGDTDLFRRVFEAMAHVWGDPVACFEEYEAGARKEHDSGNPLATALLSELLLMKAGYQRQQSDEAGAASSEAQALALLGQLVEHEHDEFLSEYEFLRRSLPADVIENAELLMGSEGRERKHEAEVEWARMASRRPQKA